MKTKSIILTLTFASILTTPLHAQDSRERFYYYEILEPRHEPKPLVNGFAEKRIEENLNRGLVAAKSVDGNGIYLNWRLLKTDTDRVTFNIFRLADGKTKKLTKTPLITTTDFIDSTPYNGLAEYWLEIKDNSTSKLSERITVDGSILQTQKSKLPAYKSIPLKNGVTAGKIAVADLNGDGVYDYIIRHPQSNVDPGMPNPDNGTTYKIEAYLSDGTYLWTKDLGNGIEPGVWYSPFVAYDFDGDGKAEVMVKTASLLKSPFKTLVKEF